MSAGISLATAATVAGIASSAVSIGNTLFGGSDQPTGGGGNTAGGGYYDPYAAKRPQYFEGLETLMGKGGTPGTSFQDKPLTYAEWVKQNPTSGGSNPSRYSDISPLGTNFGNIRNNNYNNNGNNLNGYNDYVKNFKPIAATEGVSGNQAAINMVMNSPTYMGGYQSGQRTLNAGLARTGQIGSGAEQLALQNYGQDYFNQQYQNLYNQYSGLSKATDAPLSMANQNQLAYNARESNNTNFGQALGSIGQLGNQVADLRANATWMPSSFQDTSQPFTANWGNLDA